MRDFVVTKTFRRQYKKLKRSGRRDMSKLDLVMKILIEEESLAVKYKDHFLGGKWKGYRECHIEGDLISFIATGSHSELFG